MVTICCPHCGSDLCQSYAVLNAHGTSQYTEHRRGSMGIGVVGDRVGLVRTGGSKATGVQQTAIGAMTAPPAKKPIGKWLAWGFLFPPLWLVAWYGYIYNSSEWPKLYDQWQRFWLCNKCGNSFELAGAQTMGALTSAEVAAVLPGSTEVVQGND